jgi:hypothetical protein
MMPPERKGRLIAQQLGERLASVDANVARCVKDCLPSSRVDTTREGRVLVLRYGPSKAAECRCVNGARSLIAEALTDLDGGELIAVRAEYTG